MPLIGPFLRFSTKIGILGGACYYTTQAGLWGDSSQTEQLYKDLYKTAAPYIKQSSIEVPEIPRLSDYKLCATQTWNRGVIASTDFVANLPTHTSNWACSAYNKINQLVSDPSPPTA